MRVLFLFVLALSVVCAPIPLDVTVFDITKEYTVNEVCDTAIGILDIVEIVLWRASADMYDIDEDVVVVEERDKVSCFCMVYGDFTIFNVIAGKDRSAETGSIFLDRRLVHSDEMWKAHFSDRDGKLRIVFRPTRKPIAVAESLGLKLFN